MIAQPRLAEPPRHVERVRAATVRRVRRTRRRIHRPVFAVISLAVLLLVMALGYVTGTSNITSLNYAVSRSAHERATLIEETQRLEDRIARLKSPERLAGLAAQLKLSDPHVYAVVSVPAPKAQPKPQGIAFFGWIAHLDP